METQYRVRLGALARLCNCGSHDELLHALRQSGQAFATESPLATQRQDAEALQRWFDDFEMPPAPSTNVAVVTSASRPGPLDSPSRPKALLRVGDATLLTHCLRGICRAGVRHVVLVLGGPTSKAVAEHVAAMRWESYFTSLRQVDLGTEYASGHAASLLAAARVLLGPGQVPRHFLLVGVDHVYHHSILRGLVDFELKAAGAVLVETEPEIIVRLRAAAHSTAVRVVVSDSPSDVSREGPPNFFVSPEKEHHLGRDDELVDARPDFFFASPDPGSEMPPWHARTERRLKTWVRAIGRDLDRYNGVEAGAFVLTPRVFDALQGLARVAPYFTLSEALAKFCGDGDTSTLRALETRGLPWIAIETAEQHVDASIRRSPLFSFEEHRPAPVRRRGYALSVDVVYDSEEPAIVERLEDEESGLLSFFDKRAVQRKVSASSLAALIDSYDEAHDSPSTGGELAQQEGKDPVGLLLVKGAGENARAALAVFVDEDVEDDAEECDVKRDGMRKRRRLSLLPASDVERLRLGVFATRGPTKLALRVERRVPPGAWLILVAACAACSSTSTFERELPDDVDGALRSLWRQSLATILFGAVEVGRLLRRKKDTMRTVTVGFATPLHRVATLVAVVAGFAVQNMALFVALLFVPTSMALTLCNATPIWLVAYSVLFTAKPAPKVVVLGATVGFFGAVILCVATLDAPDDRRRLAANDDPLVGVAVGLVGGVGGAFYVSAAKHAKHVPPTQLLCLANTGAAILSLAAVALQSSTSVLRPFDPDAGVLGWIAPNNRIDCIFLSIVVDGVGVCGLICALRYVDAIVVSVAILLEPVLASLIDSAAGVGTLAAMTPSTYLGSFVLFVGCAIVATSSTSSKDDVDATDALEPVGRPEHDKEPPMEREPPSYSWSYQPVTPPSFTQYSSTTHAGSYRSNRPAYYPAAVPSQRQQTRHPTTVPGGFVPMPYAQTAWHPQPQPPAADYGAIPSTDVAANNAAAPRSVPFGVTTHAQQPTTRKRPPP